MIAASSKSTELDRGSGSTNAQKKSMSVSGVFRTSSV